jgi:hypothetical protein
MKNNMKPQMQLLICLAICFIAVAIWLVMIHDPFFYPSYVNPIALSLPVGSY